MTPICFSERHINIIDFEIFSGSFYPTIYVKIGLDEHVPPIRITLAGDLA